MSNKIIYKTKVTINYSKEIDPENGYEEGTENNGLLLSFESQAYSYQTKEIFGGNGRTVTTRRMVAGVADKMLEPGSTQNNVLHLTVEDTDEDSGYISVRKVGSTGSHEYGYALGLMHAKDNPVVPHKQNTLEVPPNTVMTYDKDRSKGATTEQLNSAVNKVKSDRSAAKYRAANLQGSAAKAASNEN